MGDDKVLLTQNSRDSSGKITTLLFTCGHGPALQARDLQSPDKPGGWGFGQVLKAIRLCTTFSSATAAPAQVTTLLTGIDGEMGSLIAPQGEPAVARQEAAANTHI